MLILRTDITWFCPCRGVAHIETYKTCDFVLCLCHMGFPFQGRCQTDLVTRDLVIRLLHMLKCGQCYV